jgi:hypothetical protein
MARTGKTTFPVQFLTRRTLSFIALQLIFLLSFNFLNFGNVFKLIAVMIAVIMLALYWRLWSEDTKTDLILMVTSFVIFALFYALSPIVLETQSVVFSVLTLLGLPAIFIVGYGLTQQKWVSLKAMLIAIVFGISLLVCISWVYTMYRYLPLYRLLYQDEVIYILGEMYRISAEAKWLVGFQFLEVDVHYISIYVALLLALSPGLLWLNKRIAWKENVWWMIPLVIGCIIILTMPLLSVLPWIMPAWIFVLFDRYQPKLKGYAWYKKLPLFSLTCIGIVIVIFVLDAFNVLGLSNMVSAIPPLRWIFNHPLVERYQAVLRIGMEYPLGGFVPIIVGSTIYQTTGSLVFDTLNQAGIFAFIGVILGLFFMVNSMMTFARQTPKSLERTLTVSVMITLAFYFVFLYDMFPYIREALRQQPLLVVHEPLFMVLILLFGATATDPLGLFSKAKNQVKTPLKLEPTKPNLQKEKLFRKETVQLKKSGRWKAVD